MPITTCCGQDRISIGYMGNPTAASSPPSAPATRLWAGQALRGARQSDRITLLIEQLRQGFGVVTGSEKPVPGLRQGLRAGSRTGRRSSLHPEGQARSETRAADEQAHREPDPAHKRDAIDMRPRACSGQSAQWSFAAAQVVRKHPDLLSHEQTRRNAKRDRVREAPPSSCPGSETPALANPKTGTIRYATQGWRACSRIWSGESGSSGRPGRAEAGSSAREHTGKGGVNAGLEHEEPEQPQAQDRRKPLDTGSVEPR